MTDVLGEPHIALYDGKQVDGAWWLTRHGIVIATRMKRFRRAWWKTEAGCYAARAVLNAELLK